MVGTRKFRVELWVMTLAIGVLACRAAEWKGFVYPDRNNLLVHREIGVFASLEACRLSARSYLRDIGSAERGDYECGKNCRRKDGLTVEVCEATER
jgi:hypothetical protein